MKPIDEFLARHDVDVGKSFGLFSLAGAVLALVGMIAELLVGRIHIDFSAPIGLILGIALWKHAHAARTVLLIIAWGIAVAIIGLLVATPFTGTANLTLTLGGVIRHPTIWQVRVLGAVFAPIVGFTLAVLHSERARAEFNRPSNTPATPRSVPSPAAEEPRQR